jgi:hypothetical protein
MGKRQSAIPLRLNVARDPRDFPRELPAGTLEGSEEDRARERVTFNHRRQFGERTPEEIHNKIRRGEEFRIWCRERRLLAWIDLRSINRTLRHSEGEDEFLRSKRVEAKEHAVKVIEEMDGFIRVSYEVHSYQEDRVPLEIIAARNNALDYAREAVESIRAHS